MMDEIEITSKDITAYENGAFRDVTPCGSYNSHAA
jgi:hypothetical protein